MRNQHIFRRTTAWLTAFLWLAGCGSLLPALADAWPEETVTDKDGKRYKQVRTQDGGVEVWQLIGIYGSPEQAMEAVRLPEERKGPEELIIGSKPYSYEMKRVSDQTGENGDKEKKKKTKTTGKRLSRPFHYKFKTGSRRKGSLRLVYRPGEKTSSGTVDDTIVQKSRNPWIWMQRNRNGNTRGLQNVMDKMIPYNQIYLQDNRGSGR